MHRNSTTVSTKQQRIAAAGETIAADGFTSLAHLMDIDWLQEAYRRTRKDGAAGVDGMTAEQYEANLKSNLEGLLDRVKAGTYRAPPVRRAAIQPLPPAAYDLEAEPRQRPKVARDSVIREVPA